MSNQENIYKNLIEYLNEDNIDDKGKQYIRDIQNHLWAIKEASQKGTLTFFVGAGVSMISGAHSWWSLMQELIKPYKVKLKTEKDEVIYPKIYTDYPTKAQYIFTLKSKEYEEDLRKIHEDYKDNEVLDDKFISILGKDYSEDLIKTILNNTVPNEDLLNDNDHNEDSSKKINPNVKSLKDIRDAYYQQRFNNDIKAILKDDELKPNDIHRYLFELEPSSIITTNYDTLLERASAEYSLFYYESITKDKDVAKIAGNRFILKVHGDFESGKIVFKEKDYLDYEKDFELISNMLKSIFSTNTVVFIGYSLADSNIKAILNWVNNLLDIKLTKIYFIHTDDKLDEDSIEYNKKRGLKVIDARWIFKKEPPKNKEDKDYEEKKTKFYKDLYSIALAVIDDPYYSYNKKDAFKKFSEILEPLKELNYVRLSDILKVLREFDLYFKDNSYTDKSKNINFLLYFNKLKEKNKFQSINENNQYLVINNMILKYFENIFPKKEDDIFTILLNYNFNKIDEILNTDYKDDIEFNFKKAFFMYYTRDYNKSKELFNKVSVDAFKKYYEDKSNKSLLYFYLSKVNIYILQRIEVSLKENIFEEIATQQIDITKIFNSMPLNFRKRFIFFKNIVKDLSIETTEFFYRYEDVLVKINLALKECKNKDTDINKYFCYIYSALNFALQNLRFIISNSIIMMHSSIFNRNIRDLIIYIFMIYETVKTSKTFFTDFKFKIDEKYMELNGKTLDDLWSYFQVEQVFYFCFIEFFVPNNLDNLFKQTNIKLLFNKDSNLYKVFKSNISNRLKHPEYLADYKIANILCIATHLDLELSYEEFKFIEKFYKEYFMQKPTEKELEIKGESKS